MNFLKIALISFVMPLSVVFADEIKNEQVVKNTNNLNATESELPLSGLPKAWIQGNPITKWEKDRVYILEFWATWCGPCIQAMPHMEAINEQIKKTSINAEVVGINVFDTVSLPKLKEFLKKQRVKVTYTMGVDTEKTRTTQKYWLTPLKVDGIPHTIVVKNGKILWRDVPGNLSFDLVKKMTKSDFTKESIKKDAQQQAQEKTWTQNELSKIYNLFLSGKYEEANVLRSAYVIDERPSLSQKIDTFSLVANIFYSWGKYNDFLRELEKLANTFPNERRAQFEVISNVLDSDDASNKKELFQLAEKCARQMVKLDSDANNPQSVSLELLSRILESELVFSETSFDKVYAEMIEVQKSAVKYSRAGKLLTRIKENIKGSPTAVFDNSFLKSDIKSKNKINGEVVPSTSKSSKDFLEFLNTLSWAQGVSPKFLPANKTIFIEVWNPPTNNGIVSGMMRARTPARWFREKTNGLIGVQVFAFVPTTKDTNNIEVVQKWLEKPFYKTTIPVALIDSNELAKRLMEPYKIMRAPVGFALRDGEVIWAGNPQDVPEWVVETALDGNYKDAEGKLIREKEAKKQKEVWKAFTEIRKLYAEDKLIEAKELLDKNLSEFKKSSGIMALVYEILMGEPFSKKDYVGVAKFSNELLDLYPNDNFIGERQLKILTSNPELREVSLPTIEKAIKQMVRTKRNDATYVTLCLTMLANLKFEEKNWGEALGFAQAAIKESPEQKRLELLLDKKR